ncbi:hypothetical protein [Mycolicibacterium hodleri]|uniref:DUF4386 domain-containing protein n=1 Tax=Mycolicibacterium hodleri TaxID=49897 RepID=A0A502E522_9MYCO|nr:hypothetical protein [Mycolicibacterium hodleri]TPG32444.1 hypothetical protein EAH80_19415 [Mycolicibacterium hodleri]
MSRLIQLCCAWAGSVFFVLYVIAFVGFARFVPPPAPSWDAVRIDALFTEHAIQIRAGMVLGLIATALLIPFFAVISVQIARIERRLPVLALIQFGGAVLLIVFFQLCGMLWIAATFRSELDSSTVRVLNDLSWLIFVMVFPGYVLQLFCIALASFMDRTAAPIWPRWVGYLNVSVALCGEGGAIAAFFKQGPFAWNGIIGFYIPIVAFVVWIGVMTYHLHKGINRQFAETPEAIRAPGRTGDNVGVR